MIVLKLHKYFVKNIFIFDISTIAKKKLIMYN